MHLIKFLSTGKYFGGLQLGDQISKVREALGEPNVIVGDKRVGFMHFDNCIRIGYNENVIDELDIYFVGGEDIQFAVDLEIDELVVSKKTQIHQFVYILNVLKIPWEVINQKSLRSFCLKTSSGVNLAFDLETGFIEIISKLSE